MRDFRDAKVMARALRDGLKDKTPEVTHSESLELVAKAFGCDNWNILSARIDAAEPRAGAEPARTPILYCSFCGKTQHQVRKLIAGPHVYICDECVDLCNDIVDDPESDPEFLRLVQGDEQGARGMSTEQLAHYVDLGRKGVERNRIAVTCIERRRAMRDGDVPADDDPLALPRHLKNKTPDELVALQHLAERALKRYEDALRIATTVLGERRP
jgi:hypothetical protein